ncbi:MAG: dihydrofolate reductase [Xanthobacteraceae bacterium]
MSGRPCTPEVVFVVAIADNGVIGQDGGMPWRLSSDLKRFKRLTLGKPVVMGRKTFASIGRPLPGRTNIVVTRDPGFAVPGVAVAPTPEHALEAARGDALRRGASDIAVIGGANIFAQLWDHAARLEITKVHASPQGDTRLPPINREIWLETAREHHPAGPGDSADVTYLTYRRRA